MSYYDYKIVPAPKKAKKVKGVSNAAELFALTLSEAINEVARQGWEYHGTETLAIEAPGGWFRRGSTDEHTVLVFRKAREHLSPRIAADSAVEPAPALAPAPPPRVLPPRAPEPARNEPVLGHAAPEPTDARFRPRLGPAGSE